MFILAKILKALHSDAGPWSLSFGIVFGFVMGLTPLIQLHNLVILFIVLFFRVNLSTFLLSFGIFSAVALAFDSMMMSVGESILLSESLHSTFTAFYNTSLGRLSQFYNTLTMGSLVVSLALSPVVLISSKFLVVKYRSHVLEWAENLHIMQVLKGSKVYQIYQSMGG